MVDVPDVGGDLLRAAQQCLAEADPLRKVALTQAYAAAFRAGRLKVATDAPPPEPIRMPGRPAQLMLVHPREVPRRGLVAWKVGLPSSTPSPISNSTRSTWPGTRCTASVACRRRFMPTGSAVPTTNRGISCCASACRCMATTTPTSRAQRPVEMCEKTAHDGLARMALVPRVLEARGLDVTPGMIEKLRNVGDGETADVLEVILREEVAHVAAGSRWYRWYCDRAGVEPRARFRNCLWSMPAATCTGRSTWKRACWPGSMRMSWPTLSSRPAENREVPFLMRSATPRACHPRLAG